MEDGGIKMIRKDGNSKYSQHTCTRARANTHTHTHTHTHSHTHTTKTHPRRKTKIRGGGQTSSVAKRIQLMKRTTGATSHALMSSISDSGSDSAKRVKNRLVCLIPQKQTIDIPTQPPSHRRSSSPRADTHHNPSSHTLHTHRDALSRPPTRLHQCPPLNPQPLSLSLL